MFLLDSRLSYTAAGETDATRDRERIITGVNPLLPSSLSAASSINAVRGVNSCT